MYPDEGYSSIGIDCIAVIEQVDDFDCGLFAIAYAQSLCLGEDPAFRRYNQSKMRNTFNAYVHNRFDRDFIFLNAFYYKLRASTQRISVRVFVDLRTILRFIKLKM